MSVLDTIQSEISTNIVEGLRDPARASTDSMVGLTSAEARTKASPMRALRWARQESDFKYELYIELTESDGCQGLMIYNESDSSLVDDLCVPMRGGFSGKIQNIIYENNKKIAELLVSHIENDIAEWSDLEAAITAEIVTGKENPLGYGGPMAGLSPAEADLRNPSRCLKWLNDNSDYGFKSITKLRDDGGDQGLKVYDNDGEYLRTLSVPLGGGVDADPRKLIYRNNSKILLKAISVVWEANNA